MSQDSIADAVVRPQVGQMTNCGSITSRDKKFSLLRSIQTGSCTHPLSSLVGSGVLSLRLKWLGHEASAKIKNDGSYTSTSLCLHGVHRDNITSDYVFITQSVLNF